MVISVGRASLGAVGRIVWRLLAVICLVAITACAATYENHGYVPTDEELSFLKVGKDTRESVENMVGQPSASGLLNDVGWFYVQTRWKKYGIRPMQEIGREVLVISFTEDGVVSNIERFGLEDGHIVVLSRRVTTSNIAGQGFIKQLFGNVGGLSASDVIQ